MHCECFIFSVHFFEIIETIVVWTAPICSTNALHRSPLLTWLVLQITARQYGKHNPAAPHAADDISSALHILRIVQESIANILKHTRASKIRIGTAAQADGVRVIIEDNGQGFDVQGALAAGKGHGLYNQQRRARAVDGTVDWVSTRFTLWLPLERTPQVA
ncbi:hypothetical protein FAZ69_15735 [Trinickia terrae]|uniref:histidine kinase n=1 Tax=Trinickia terrae TaxID=2571161 RepID=A0A4U1I3D4_9BURK|nr:hypothetical protein FAZ69_15735 [Trinickia terrae]